MANLRLAAEECFGVQKPPANLVELLHFWASRCGERKVYTFQRDDGHEITLNFAALDQRARAIAARLQQTCRPGDRALLLYPAGLDFIAAFCGCAYAGVLAVPVCYPKPKRPMPRLSAIAHDSHPQAALTNRKTLEQFDFHLAPTPLCEDAWIASDDIPDALALEWKAPAISPSDVAFLQYTSGSTSDPKGVMVSHCNLLHNLEAIRRGFGIEFDLQPGEPRNKGVFWLPAYHDMGLIGGILTALYVGGHSMLMSPGAFLQRPYRWLEAISQTRARISGAPNFAFELCVSKVPAEKRAQLDLSCWEICFCGAEPIRAETLLGFAEAFAECGFRADAFYPCYGLAESTLMVAGGNGPGYPQIKTVARGALAENRLQEASEPSSDATRDLVCCGNAVLDHQIAIVDPATGRQCANGEVGEIWIKGPSVASGYWRRPAETQRAFGATIAEDRDGPYLRTGDLGVLDQDGLYVTGRLKDVIIIRGRNHYPQDIERTVECAHRALRSGAGAAVAIEIQGQEALVVIQEVDRAYRDLDLDEVARAIRRAVADEHEINPYAVVLIRHASLPVTTSGKVQRGLARRLYLAGELKVIDEWVAHPTPLAAPTRQGAAIGLGEDRPNGKAHPLHNGQCPKPSRTVASENHNSTGHAECHGSHNGHCRCGNGCAEALPADSPSANRATNGSHNLSPHVNGFRLGAPMNGSPACRSAEGNRSVNGSSKNNRPARIQFERFPLTTDEIDRLAERIERWILDWLVEHAAVEPAQVDRHKPFAEYGMDSLTAVEMSHQLEEWLGVELTAVLAWNYPTPHKISKYLAQRVGGGEVGDAEAADDAKAAAGDDFERLLAEIENLSESEARDALSRGHASP